MSPQRIELHIERLTLNGFTLTGAQSRRLQVALESELSRLLTEGGLRDAFAAGISFHSLPPLTASLSPDASPAALGRDLARSLYAGIGPSAVKSAPAARPAANEAGVGSLAGGGK